MVRRPRKWRIGVLLALPIVIVGLSFANELTTTEKDFEAAANSTMEQELVRRWLDREKFIFSERSSQGQGIFQKSRTYIWTSRLKPTAQIGVTISFVDIDFWGHPRSPDCHKEREGTIADFGEVCQ